MELEAKILVLNTADSRNRIFPNGCNITYPEEVPIIDYVHSKDGKLLGTVKILKDNNGLGIRPTEDTSKMIKL